MPVEPKIAISRMLADLNLAVRYGIAMRIICEQEIMTDFNLAVYNIDRQPPNFPAVR